MTTTTDKMPLFEENDVARAAVRITNAGDGLSEALKIQPKAIHLGDEVFYVLRGTCTQINHKADGDEVVTRLHTVKAEEITEVEPHIAKKMLEAAAEELERKRAEATGQLQLDAEAAAEERESKD